MLLRWIKFSAVGGAGVIVQLAMLALLRSGFGWHYLVATAVAVETAVIHNFVWHARWTWADRPATLRDSLIRLLRFNLSTGLVSVTANLLVMSVLVGLYGLPYLPSNVVAIIATGLVNFLVSEFFIFRSA
jgi:putative flippase GtrA